ncbi:MAG: NFACT RNA binding domain-containing protein [Erysipelotrichaceae bacterium]|nr:NFACT RNA binding domain-containing protein [Erysipelotrichaceae bacterium]
MALDGIVLNKIAIQLQAIIPIRITKINNISDTEVLFQLKSNNEKDQLIISCHSQFNRINLTAKKYPIPKEPSNFVMLLRKHLENGMIVKIEQNDLDRYLIFHIHTHNEIGDPITRQLFVELMGKYANLILVDNDHRILDALKRIPPFENTQRTIQPGANYTYLEPQDKQDPFQTKTYDLNRSFTEQFSGFSPLLSKEFEYRMHNGQSFLSIMKEISLSNDLYVSNYQGKLYFHVIPLTQFEVEPRSFTLMEGLDEIYFYQEEVDRIRQQTGDLYKFVRREIKKNQQKMIKLNDSLSEAIDCEKWRVYGDLIFAYQDQIEKGMKRITLPRFDDESPVIIDLDPKLDAKQNAKKCFQKYSKGKNGQFHIRKQIELTQDELDYFSTIQKQLKISDFKDALEIREELSNYGYLKANKKAKTNKKAILNYIEIAYDTDTTIYVGKNNRQNEYITFKLANKSDHWFHVSNYHGAHVLVKTNDLNEKIIRLAAMLAGYFSEARQSSSIPVSYTLIRDLKKIPKAKVGQVSMSTYKTIYIDIDKDVLRDYITLKEL